MDGAKKCPVYILQSPCVIILSHSISVADSPSGGNRSRKRHHDSTNRKESSYSGGESSKPEHDVRNSPKGSSEEPPSMNGLYEQGETNNMNLKQPHYRPHYEPHSWASIWVPLQVPLQALLQAPLRTTLRTTLPTFGLNDLQNVRVLRNKIHCYIFLLLTLQGFPCFVNNFSCSIYRFSLLL